MKEREKLAQMKEDLRFREIKLLEREFEMKMNDTLSNAPTPIKRKGKFSKARLKVSFFFFLKDQSFFLI